MPNTTRNIEDCEISKASRAIGSTDMNDIRAYFLPMISARKPLSIEVPIPIKAPKVEYCTYEYYVKFSTIP